MEADELWNIFENHGLKLPDYLIKLLLCSGYDNLQSLSKLVTHQLIGELENYATDCLDAADIGVSEVEAKYYFSRQTMKFHILPGHKHLLIAAAELAVKMLHISANDNDSEHEKVREEHDHSLLMDDEKSGHNGLHFLSEFSTLGSRSGNKKNSLPSSSPEADTSVEEEQNSLVEFLKTWIARKVLSGHLAPFLYDVDYRVQVYRPKSCNQSTRTDIYSFVCLRCNTTIRAFKRANGQHWNAANVCRHITSVHFLMEPSKTQKMSNLKSNYLISSHSTPPLSDSTTNEQDPLN